MNTNQTTPYDAGEIREIKQIIEVATTLRMSWFRGHPEKYGNLTPKIFRTEHNIIDHFKRVAPALTKNIPNQDDHCDWLLYLIKEEAQLWQKQSGRGMHVA